MSNGSRISATPRNNPVVRRPGDHSPTHGASAGCRLKRLRTSTRVAVGQRQGQTLAQADRDPGVGGPNKSCEVGERAAPWTRRSKGGPCGCELQEGNIADAKTTGNMSP